MTGVFSFLHKGAIFDSGFNQIWMKMHEMTGRIALVEFGGSHHECLFAQYAWLKDEAEEIIILTTPSQKGELARALPRARIEAFPVSGKIGDDRGRIWEIRRFLKKEKIESLVFNTAQGTVVLALCILLPKRIRKFGIVHDIAKINGKSRQQRIISGFISAYFVLAGYLLRNVKESKVPVYKLYTSVYPDFPPIREAATFTVVIPGAVEFKRREYLRLIDELPAEIPSALRIIFLGRFGSEGEKALLLEKIERKNLRKHVVFFEDRVPQEEFYGRVAGADLLLPLVDVHSKQLRRQISGTFNLAIAFRKKMLLPEAGRELLEEYGELAEYYQGSAGLAIEKIMTAKIGATECSRLEAEMRSSAGQFIDIVTGKDR